MSPEWIEKAKSQLGVSRWAVGDNPVILQYLKDNSSQPNVEKAWWSNQKESWCGTFAGWCLSQTGYKIPKDWYRATSYNSENVGVVLDKPALYCIVVFKRKGGGHVGFCVGKTKEDKLLILGGNQNSSVNVMAKTKDDVIGYIYPMKHDGTVGDIDYDLPIGTAEDMGTME